MYAGKFYLIAVLLFMPGSRCLASDSSIDRATLHGLTAVKIVIDQPTSEMEREGLDRNQLRTTVEQKLRDAGIKIDNDAVEFLGLSIASARMGRRAPFALMLNLGLYQVVALNRDKTTKTVAETWGAQRVLSVAPRGLDRAVGDVVDELVDQFVKAYQTANPK